MGTKRPHCRRDWDNDLREIGKQVGFEVLAWNGYPAKRNKVLIKCEHGERWVFPNGQVHKEHCCRVASKIGENNPFYNKPTWNAGTKGISTGHGFGYRPSDEIADQIGRLYLVEYIENEEIHYKLGITSRTTKQRLQGKLHKTLKEWELPLGRCFDLEQATLRYATDRGYRYSSPTTTELIRPEGITSILEFIERSCDVTVHEVSASPTKPAPGAV
jgi:hypothetical protein